MGAGSVPGGVRSEEWKMRNGGTDEQGSWIRDRAKEKGWGRLPMRHMISFKKSAQLFPDPSVCPLPETLFLFSRLISLRLIMSSRLIRDLCTRGYLSRI